MKAKRILDKAVEGFLGVLVCAVCLVVLWQVFTRIVLNNPSSWSEEVCRYLLIWTSFVGGSLGLNNGTHMGLVLLTDRIRRPAVKTAVHMFAYLVCGLVGWIFIRYGYLYAMGGMTRTMLCCSFKMGYIYMVIPICGFIILANCLEVFYQDFQKMRGKQSW